MRPTQRRHRARLILMGPPPPPPPFPYFKPVPPCAVQPADKCFLGSVGLPVSLSSLSRRTSSNLTRRRRPWTRVLLKLAELRSTSAYLLRTRTFIYDSSRAHASSHINAFWVSDRVSRRDSADFLPTNFATSQNERSIRGSQATSANKDKPVYPSLSKSAEILKRLADPGTTCSGKAPM